MEIRVNHQTAGKIQWCI